MTRNDEPAFQPLSDGHTDITADVAALKAWITNGTPAPLPAPERLPVGAIVSVPEVFQPRSGGERWRSDAHTNNLAGSLQVTQEAGERATLGPILVYWVGDGWACLDGHHRIAAILKRTRGGKGSTVAVEVFTGTVEQAMLAATERNSRDKLPMSERDKSERAWRLLLAEAGTHQAIARACGVSTKTVQRMAAIINKHASDPSMMQTIRAMNWAGARWYDQNRDAVPEGRKAVGWMDAKIERRAAVLRKATASESPEIVAAALMFNGREYAREVARQIWKHNSYTTEHAPKIGPDGLPQFDDYDPQHEPAEF